MRPIKRQHFLSWAAKLTIGGLLAIPSLSLAQLRGGPKEEMDEWINEWLQQKALGGRLFLSRFVEPVYFLTQTTVWRAGQNQSTLPSVEVPMGFVTDFASVPQQFWSMLRPDGEYAHAAVIHDFLYWTQLTSRETADLVFKYAMEDLKIAKFKVAILYTAVRTFGNASWNENAKLKASGEKRILKVFPSAIDARWEEWRIKPDNFS